jgi:hypothetical protein
MSLGHGSTQVEQFSFTKPSDVCGISGTTVGHGTSVFRNTGNGTYCVLHAASLRGSPRGRS